MREDIRERIKMIKTGKVPEGYKKTQLGIIKEDFEEVYISKVGEFRNGINFSKGLGNNNVKFLGVGDFENISILEDADKLETIKVTANDEQLQAYFLHDEDIVFVRSNGSKELVGRNLLIHNHPGRMVYSGFCIRYRLNHDCDKTSAEYVNMWLDNGILKQLLKKENRGTNINNLNQEILGKLMIYVPKLEEQDKILKIIKNFNYMIVGLEKYIDCKRNQKKWLMQNLLTGKKRLPNCNSEWEMVKLSKVLIEQSERNKLNEVTEVKSVSNKYGFISQNEQFGKIVASNDISNYKIVKKGYIAYNPSRINVGSIALYEEDVLGVISPMYIVLKTREALSEKYFMYYCETEFFKQSMKSQLSGSVRETLKFEDLCSIKINMPSYDEQLAIIKVLKTADKEIELLEKKLELLKKEKKALMQLLLTGIVRVNES